MARCATYPRRKVIELGAVAVGRGETTTTDATVVRTAEGAAAAVTGVGAGIDMVVEGVDGDHGHGGQA